MDLLREVVPLADLTVQGEFGLEPVGVLLLFKETAREEFERRDKPAWRKG